MKCCKSKNKDSKTFDQNRFGAEKTKRNRTFQNLDTFHFDSKLEFMTESANNKGERNFSLDDLFLYFFFLQKLLLRLPLLSLPPLLLCYAGSCGKSGSTRTLHVTPADRWGGEGGGRDGKEEGGWWKCGLLVAQLAPAAATPTDKREGGEGGRQ